MKNQQMIMMIVVVLIVGAGAFFAGTKYQQSQRTSAFGAAGGRGGFARGSGAPRGGANGGAVVGQILSQDSNSITVKLMDGSSKIVLLPSSATISKTASGTIADLTTGANVAVFGTTNPDGSVTAQNVQLNPMFRGGPNGSGAPSASAAQ